LRLIQLAERQRALLLELESASERQGALVEGDAGAELLEHLAARQAIVDRIIEVSAELEPYRTRWESLLSVVPREQAAAARRTLDECSQIADRLRATDDQHRARLEEKRDAIAAELADVGRGREANIAYIERDVAPIARLTDQEA
jgi:hypothetical protein